MLSQTVRIVYRRRLIIAGFSEHLTVIVIQYVDTSRALSR